MSGPTVVQADSSLIAIRKKVRRLTASASEASLSTNDLDGYINDYYNTNFPYSIKIDQMRSVYTFFTEPNRDRYPLDVNYNQGIRAPAYFEGIKGYFFKDRNQFYNLWPRFPQMFQPISGDGVTQVFNFTIGAIPFLTKEVVLGGVDISGSPISINDDGFGNLYLQTPNPVVSVPPLGSVYQQTVPPSIPANQVGLPIAGMYNKNTLNPGLNAQTYVGTVNYVTGAFSVDFVAAGVTPIAGQNMTLWVNQYQTGRPYSLLFWNNEFHVRPVPKLIHKIEVETYLTPVQFMATTDQPILNQWWKLIAIGAALLVLEDRQDMAGIANLSAAYMRESGLALERQAVEEIDQPTYTIFNATTPTYGFGAGLGSYL